MLSLILYVCVFISAFNFGEILTNPLYNKNHKCGYDSCPKPKDGYLNVHMVSHTHNDAGWLKTVDQYFYGSKKKIQWAGVQYIIDSIIEALVKNPSRRFVYVESAFFWKWWQLQNENIRNKVKNLVNEGRLEFIGGGWTMHDEATTHYQSIIDQMSWGFRRLDDSFGDCARPRVGWQIDPFGHSRESASIMARFGFDGLLFGRLDYQDQGLRKYERRLEMIWESSANLGTKSDLFTSILYNLYSAPNWFCFDVVCGDPPIIDDKESPDYNADKRAADFVRYVNEVAKVYTTNNVLITMGGDFTYQAGSYYFLNLDRLMK
uniref:Glycoside hydrolase family 38 N-terminal domain-containing protein n=3 Tax=Clastoptera arizonana TaxID=38151 RepID=A0A1B6EBV4_9HEMI